IEPQPAERCQANAANMIHCCPPRLNPRRYPRQLVAFETKSALRSEAKVNVLSDAILGGQLLARLERIPALADTPQPFGVGSSIPAPDRAVELVRGRTQPGVRHSRPIRRVVPRRAIRDP